MSETLEKHYRDLKDRDSEKCKKNLLFGVKKRIEKRMVWLSELKGEPRRINNTIVEKNSQLLANFGLGFDIWVVSNNLSNWYRIVNNIKNGKSINSLKVFSRNVLISEKKISSVCNLLMSDDSY